MWMWLTLYSITIGKHCSNQEKRWEKYRISCFAILERNKRIRLIILDDFKTVRLSI